MPAYVMIGIDVNDQDAMDRYRALAKPTMASYGARLLAKGAPVTLEGAWSSSQMVLLEFDSAKQARAWYASPEYAKAVAAREGAATFSTLVVEA